MKQYNIKMVYLIKKNISSPANNITNSSLESFTVSVSNIYNPFSKKHIELVLYIFSTEPSNYSSI